MATITPFLSEGIHAGQRVALKTHELLWRTVGQGEVVTLSNHAVDVNARVKLAIYRGDLTVRFALLDKDDDAITGPCRLQVNSLVDEVATYATGNDGMTVSGVLGGKNVQFKLSRSRHGNRMECQISSPLTLTAYIEPGAA